jgi:hypothetical protein
MRWMWLSVALLGACVEEGAFVEEELLAGGLDEALPEDELAPPGLLEQAISQLVPGNPARATARSAPRGQRIAWVASMNARGTTCLPALGGACVDLGAPATIVGSAPANVDQWATTRFTVPRNARPGSHVFFQAITIDAAGNVSKSTQYDRTVGPLACPAIFMPVCGIDGNTYGNSCEMDGAGMLLDHSGPC